VRTVKGDFIEAQRQLTEVLRPVNGEAPKPPRTFASYMENEWAQYTRDHWKASTQITQGSLAKHIREYFHSKPLGEITAGDVMAQPPSQSWGFL